MNKIRYLHIRAAGLWASFPKTMARIPDIDDFVPIFMYIQAVDFVHCTLLDNEQNQIVT